MRKSTIIAILAMGALVAPVAYAADVTEADYQKAMKDVLGGMQASGRAIREAGDLSAAVAGAKTIDAALASIDSFWSARKDAEAVKMNAAARSAAAALGKAAEGKDVAATGEAMKALQGTCKACHDVHREQLPDKTYKLK